MEFNFQVVNMRNCIAVLVVCDVTLLYCCICIIIINDSIIKKGSLG